MVLNLVIAFATAVSYLALALASGALTQLTLSPVYGSVLAASKHQQLVAWAVLTTFLGRAVLDRYNPAKPRRYLPIMVACVPVAQFFLFRISSSLGVVNGPVLIEALTFWPILFLTGLCFSDALDAFPIYRETLPLQLISGVQFCLAVLYAEPYIIHAINSLSLSSDFYSRVNLQLMTASTAFALSPSWIGLLAIPAVAHTTYLNTHFVSNRTNQLRDATLYNSGFSILDRRESTTGYVSVIEHLGLGLRALRCDHSLLGGEWLLSDERRAQGVQGTEPIYAVFEMLEAVRLVELPQESDHSLEKTALFIGLGIGTAPKAMLAHGIATTVVELDPVVHDFATRYFDLPTNHTAVIRDAITWVSDMAANNANASSIPQTYDYIVHDVFTGGAEPLPLFTWEFLHDLLSLLSINGAIAINFAGDLALSPTKQAMHTINEIFEFRCRVFRDSPLIEGDPDSSFSNMVVFCLNPAAPSSSSTDDSAAPAPPLTFRKPVEADYLGSASRRQHLLPRAELELRFPSERDMAREAVAYLTNDNIAAFKQQQVQGARRHWAIMRKVLPSVVWETW